MKSEVCLIFWVFHVIQDKANSFTTNAKQVTAHVKQCRVVGQPQLSKDKELELS
jgi:hypothetical protein